MLILFSLMRGDYVLATDSVSALLVMGAVMVPCMGAGDVPWRRLWQGCAEPNRRIGTLGAGMVPWKGF